MKIISDKDHYRLPCGELTKSPRRAASEWAKLYRPFCKATGAKVVGFDPGVQFYYNGYSFSLPTSILKRLNERLTPS